MFRGTTTTWTASAPRFPFGRSSLWTDASWIYTRPRELATFCESVSKIYNINDNFNQRSRDSTRAWLKHFLFLTPSYCSSKLRWLSTSHCFNLRYENCFHFVKCFVERDWNYPRDFNKERWINRHTRKGGEEEARNLLATDWSSTTIHLTEDRSVSDAWSNRTRIRQARSPIYLARPSRWSSCAWDRRPARSPSSIRTPPKTTMRLPWGQQHS